MDTDITTSLPRRRTSFAALGPPVADQLLVVFGQNLKRYRECRGLSQAALGARLGIHRTYVGALERGEINLTLGRLERLARSLGADPLTLLMPKPSYGPARPGQ